MDHRLNSIASRMSLRPPQKESLQVLAHILATLTLSKEVDLAACLAQVNAAYPSVTDFERSFPSVCFALATGVGKTRLMGAFVTYLHLTKGYNNFFVVAPNLTIYNKLVQDFTPNTSKYVFQGIAEFAITPPEIITGENYSMGWGARASRWGSEGPRVFGEERIRINILNISKINAEVRGGRVPRIKRLSEMIGQSYFDYLAGLDDLVLLMDEAHRYRASAGIKALNDLNPILGLELTATPQIESGSQAITFKNVIYSYPLFKALEDGFVKEPAVATRENFNPNDYSEEQLERLKLEDGILVHENTKAELEVYARENNKRLIKPFILIVASDTDHANRLDEIIRSEEFFEGRYKSKVITVHSNHTGEEKDETVQRLLELESADNSVEIVIHVNMLKEGWDVTNLYTIIPLRAANSKTLVEQSLGRGLRVPYGRRTGIKAVDRLTIIAHDKFQEIVDEANNPNSIIRTGIVLGHDAPAERKQAVEVQPVVLDMVAATVETGTQSPAFTSPADSKIAMITVNAIKNLEHLPSSRDLTTDIIKSQLAMHVQEQIKLAQETSVGGTLAATSPSSSTQNAQSVGEEGPDVSGIVDKVVDLYIKHSIDIPQIIVFPRGQLTWGYRDFSLDTSGISMQPISKEIVIQNLQDNSKQRLKSGVLFHAQRPEDLLVEALSQYDDVSYDDHADLLYRLAGEAVQHLRTYISDEEQVIDVLHYNQQTLAELIHEQMREHYFEEAVEYEVKVVKGFTMLKPTMYSIAPNSKPQDFRIPVQDKRYIAGMVFGGFDRCLFPLQKFHSDAERRFAVICEGDSGVLKWVKPTRDQLVLLYSGSDYYEPDFVVETGTTKYLCEPKRADQIATAEVQAKAKAAYEWCNRATDHEMDHGGKPWKYVLIPHDAIQENMTLAGLAAKYTWHQIKH